MRRPRIWAASKDTADKYISQADVLKASTCVHMKPLPIVFAHRFAWQVYQFLRGVHVVHIGAAATFDIEHFRNVTGISVLHRGFR